MLERTLGPWDYRMMPNKMLELVKNVGNMEQEHTGYYVDSESEMLTILAYLNYGETTNITESMIEQIEETVRTLESRRLRREDEYETGGRTLGDDTFLGREDFQFGENRFGNNNGRMLGGF